MTDKRHLKYLTGIIKILLFSAVIWFVISNISGNIDKLKDTDFSSYDPVYMFMAVLTVFISLIYPVFVWKFLIGSLGGKINTLPALKIWFVSNLGRYIPGKVLQLAGLVYFSAAEGVSKNKAVQSVLYSQIASNGLGLLMGLSLLFIKSSGGRFPNTYHITIILTAVFFFVLWFPSFFLRSSNYFLSKFNREKIDNSLSKRNYILFILFQTVNWVLMSFTFIILVNSYTSLSIIRNPEVLFILPISWTLGLIAFFAPGGIGVREGAMSFWLSGFIPLEYALVLPWIHRIIISFAEIILTTIFYLTYQKPDYVNDSTEQNK